MPQRRSSLSSGRKRRRGTISSSGVLDSTKKRRTRQSVRFEEDEVAKTPELSRQWTHTVQGRLRSGDKRERRIHRKYLQVNGDVEEEENEEGVGEMDQGYENDDVPLLPSDEEDEEEEEEEKVEVEVPSLERAWTHTVIGRLRSGDKRESRLHRRGVETVPAQGEEAEEEEEEIEEEEEEIEEKEEEVETNNFENMKYRELQSYCRARGISSRGKKAELIDRLRNLPDQGEDDEDETMENIDIDDDSVPLLNSNLLSQSSHSALSSFTDWAAKTKNVSSSLLSRTKDVSSSLLSRTKDVSSSLLSQTKDVSSSLLSRTKDVSSSVFQRISTPFKTKNLFNVFDEEGKSSRDEYSPSKSRTEQPYYAYASFRDSTPIPPSTGYIKIFEDFINAKLNAHGLYVLAFLLLLLLANLMLPRSLFVSRQRYRNVDLADISESCGTLNPSTFNCEGIYQVADANGRAGAWCERGCSKCNFHCIAGYDIVGVPDVTCNAESGEWSASAPTCSQRRCTCQHGTASVGATCPQHGKERCFLCDEGYELTTDWKCVDANTIESSDAMPVTRYCNTWCGDRDWVDFCEEFCQNHPAYARRVRK